MSWHYCSCCRERIWSGRICPDCRRMRGLAHQSREVTMSMECTLVCDCCLVEIASGPDLGHLVEDLYAAGGEVMAGVVWCPECNEQGRLPLVRYELAEASSGSLNPSTFL